MHERITESIRNDFDENKCFFEGACGLSADLKCGNIIQVFYKPKAGCQIALINPVFGVGGLHSDSWKVYGHTPVTSGIIKIIIIGICTPIV